MAQLTMVSHFRFGLVEAWFCDVFKCSYVEIRSKPFCTTQCRDKTKKLKKLYRVIKDKHRKSGEGRKKWLFLEAMDIVLGDKPATCPAVLIDTMVERVEEGTNHEAVEAANVEVREEEGDSDFESEKYPNSSPSSASMTGHEQPSVKVSTKVDQKASTPQLSNAEKPQLKKKKQRRTV